MKDYIKVTIFSSIIILLTLLITYYDYKVYVSNTNDFINEMLNKVVEKYPLINEEEILEIINSKDYYNQSDFLNNYGFSKTELNILTSTKEIYKKNLVRNFLCATTILIIVIVTFLRKKYKKQKELNKIIEYLKSINRGEYNLEINDNSEGLISILKNEIYTTTVMLREKAEKEIIDKKNLKDSLSNISHQLKTPLTSILLLVDNLYEDNVNKDVQKEFLNDIRMQAENINFLIISMLKLSKFDANMIEFNVTKINVKKILINVLKNIDIIRELKNINIHLNGASNIFFNGDYKWELEALTNIVKNAIEHTEDGKNIYIKYEENTSYTMIEILDEGSGISPDEKKHIFERFYKGNSSSSTNFGIGLPLAKEIIEHDNGTIKVDSKIEEFTRFTIKYYK